MKVKELIEALKSMPQDLEVYSYCDHGQTPEKSSRPCVAYCEDVDYTIEGWSSDEDDAEAEGYTKKFVIL